VSGAYLEDAGACRLVLADTLDEAKASLYGATRTASWLPDQKLLNVSVRGPLRDSVLIGSVSGSPPALFSAQVDLAVADTLPGARLSLSVSLDGDADGVPAACLADGIFNRSERSLPRHFMREQPLGLPPDGGWAVRFPPKADGTAAKAPDAQAACLDAMTDALFGAPLDAWDEALCLGPFASNPSSVAVRERRGVAQTWSPATLALSLSVALLVARAGMLALSQVVFATHGDRGGGSGGVGVGVCGGRSALTLRSAVQYKLASRQPEGHAGSTGSVPGRDASGEWRALSAVAVLFLLGLVAVAGTAAALLLTSESVIVSVEPYPGSVGEGSSSRGDIVSARALALDKQRLSSIGLIPSGINGRTYFSMREQYVPDPRACRQVVRSLVGGPLDQIVATLQFRVLGDTYMEFAASSETAGGQGYALLTFLVNDDVVLPVTCPFLWAAAQRLDSNDASVLVVSAPPPVVSYTAFSTDSTEVNDITNFTDGPWPLLGPARDCITALRGRLNETEAEQAVCGPMEERSPDNPYLVERRVRAHTRAEAAALTLSFVLAYCGVAAVLIKLAVGRWRLARTTGRRSTAGSADAADAPPRERAGFMRRRNFLTPAAVLNHKAEPGNDYRFVAWGSAAVVACALAAAAVSWEVLRGRVSVTSSLGVYDDAASSNLAVGQNYVVFDVAAASSSLSRVANASVRVSLDGAFFVDDADCRSRIASLSSLITAKQFNDISFAFAVGASAQVVNTTVAYDWDYVENASRDPALSKMRLFVEGMPVECVASNSTAALAFDGYANSRVTYKVADF
jgi:hypothetical protein